MQEMKGLIASHAERMKEIREQFDDYKAPLEDKRAELMQQKEKRMVRYCDSSGLVRRRDNPNVRSMLYRPKLLSSWREFA
jgi:hypothetical protein